MTRALATSIPCLFAFLAAGSAVAGQHSASVGKAFADHCFSPYLTAETANANLAPSGARIDFYDLRPFSSSPVSAVKGRPATSGTDRRCEVAFDGSASQQAIAWAHKGLEQEGLADRLATVPADFPRQNGTVFIAAAQLNPNRIAVVQIGVRDGSSGPETFLNVERLTPLNEVPE